MVWLPGWPNGSTIRGHISVQVRIEKVFKARSRLLPRSTKKKKRRKKGMHIILISDASYLSNASMCIP